MRRQDAVAVAALIGVIACIVVVGLRIHVGSQPTRVVIGSPAPSGAATPDNGRQTIGPHVDEATGDLVIAVGDAALANGVQISVTDVKAPYADASLSATRGELMLVDVDVHNAAGQDRPTFSVSTRDNFALDDASGQTYPPLTGAAAPKPPDGTLAPGATLDGSLLYDVPAGQTYQLRFKSPVDASTQIVIDLGRR